MNLHLIYLWRNLARNPLRTGLTTAAVALPIIIYVLSTSVVNQLEVYLDNCVKQLRLAVTHKASLVYYLPSGYGPKIQALDPTRRRLRSVCAMRWIGGQVPDDPQPLSTLAVDHNTFLDTFPEYNLTPDQRRQWLHDRQAIIVGHRTAGQFRWNVGDRITLKPSVPPYGEMEFHVVSTAPEASDQVTLFCRLDYLEETLKAAGGIPDQVGFFFVKCGTAADLDEFRVRIDQQFKGAIDETRTQDEKAFMNEFITQQFNLPRNLAILSAVTVAVATLAAANTMSMNFRDRLNEFATLKSLGFRPAHAWGLIQAESLAVCAAGGALGVAIPYVAFTWWPLSDVYVPVIHALEIAPAVCGWALLISLAIGLAAGVWPSWLAARLHVVAALRHLQ